MNKISLSTYDGKWPKDFADKVSDIRARTDFLWNQYMKIAAISASGAFRTPKNNSGRYDTLDFSKDQRDKLLQEMEDRFGTDVKDTNAKGKSCVELAPAFFYQGLLRGLGAKEIKFEPDQGKQ